MKRFFAGKLTNKFLKDEKAAINEFIGLIVFLMIIFCVLVPLIVELLAYTGQAQEVDRLTKIASKRACTLLANPNIGVAADLKQGSLGVGTDISAMQPLVNSIFQQEAAHPQTYFENTQDKQNIDLKIFDIAGQEIDIRNDSNWVDIEDPNGAKGRVLLVGTNSESALCPSGGGSDWKYCLQPGSDDAIKQQVKKTGIGGGTSDKDLIQRLQRFQAGRCLPGETNCKNDFVGRIDRCTVCVTKTRQSIFSKTAFFNNIISCTNKDDKRIIPCAISTCATEKLTRASTKRGYNPAYQSQRNLGAEQFNSVEVDYREKQNERNTLLKEETKLTGYQDKKTNEATKNIFNEMNEQFVPVKDLD
ncbi:MAG: hypothetical protein SFU25_07735 [Candidatus Caenarcaniphilales bacterium]|nr:hypothetical protein [Candidatus Caenarcaniphilales bacterium]